MCCPLFLPPPPPSSLIYVFLRAKSPGVLSLRCSLKIQVNLPHGRSDGDIGWWKDLNFVTTLPYVRDRAVECYFWALGVYFEPQYSQICIMLAKIIAMIMVVDDTYDAYGTVEELAAYTDVIQRYE
ncbi:hypothetical protein HAX54_044499 [Datura stramonium]|uniref:Terpene synthase metal-binding domain-containing protein n=1 Tax=Datura stramonium TaxID=4076 RepID=A0ABS8SP89_DATST|nr:hypothetical protein [Datura stramonium]